MANQTKSPEDPNGKSLVVFGIDQAAHYDAVVEERSLEQLCGFPACTRNIQVPERKRWAVNYATKEAQMAVVPPVEGALCWWFWREITGKSATFRVFDLRVGFSGLVALDLFTGPESHHPPNEPRHGTQKVPLGNTLTRGCPNRQSNFFLGCGSNPISFHVVLCQNRGTQKMLGFLLQTLQSSRATGFTWCFRGPTPPSHFYNPYRQNPKSRGPTGSQCLTAIGLDL